MPFEASHAPRIPGACLLRAHPANFLPVPHTLVLALFYLTPYDQTYISRLERFSVRLAVTVWLSSRGAAAISAL